jgi:hypothetical protein
MSIFDDHRRAGAARLAAEAAKPPPTSEESAWIRRLRRVLKDQPAALYLVACYDSLSVVKDHGDITVPVESVNARMRDD